LTRQGTNSSLPVITLFLLSFVFSLLLLPSNALFGVLSNNLNVVLSSLPSAPNVSDSVQSPTISANDSLGIYPSVNMANYTLLVYIVGSDLESQYYSASKDLQEMRTAAIGNSTNINVIVQTGGGGGTPDRSPSGIERVIDFTKVQRHQITNGDFHTLMDLGVINMAEPTTLTDFIKWGISNFPASKYAIILWDHGSGLNGFGKDILFNNDTLTPVELGEAFSAAKYETDVDFELIGFDACLMSSLEVASRLYEVAGYMVSSQEVEPSWGWDYKAIIERLMTDPNQSGSTLGITIADSFAKHSEDGSKLQEFGADKDITLSVIHLSKIPQLVKDVNVLSNALVSNISDLPSALDISKSIALTESYGRSSRASSGLIDLFDLTQNLQDKYPALSENIEAVQNSLKNASIYTVNGSARPNAHGISIYLPLRGNEFSSTRELSAVDLDWFALSNIQESILSSDTQPPILKSIKQGGNITSSVYGSDISTVFAQIITNSSQGPDLIYTQNIDPSIIDGKGFLHYGKYQMLVICNEVKCIPASMNLEINRDNKFAFIPVRLESGSGDINQDVSLVYEINKDGKIDFLGVTPEINPEETIPKAISGLDQNDRIFVKALPARHEAQHVGDISSQKLRNTSNYIEDGPLEVSDPSRINASYADIMSPFSISFTICDYSDNCDKTRWYNIDPNQETLSPHLPLEAQFGYDVAAAENQSNPGNLGDDPYTYINPTFGFTLQYPSDWIRESQNIYDDLSSDLFSDPIVVSLSPSEYIGVRGSGYRPSIILQATDWPRFNEQSPKYLFDFLNSTSQGLGQNYEIVNAGHTVIAGNPGFAFTIEYISKAEQFLDIAEDKRTETMITTLMNGRMYTITFGSYSSQFETYKPVAESIISSFEPYPISNPSQNQNNVEMALDFGRLTDLETADVNNSSIRDSIKTQGASMADDLTTTNTHNTTGDILFSIFSDKKYGYSIKYPANVGLGKPFSLEDASPNLVGNLFSLDNSSQSSPNPAESAQVIVAAFYTNETDLITKLVMLPPAFMPDLARFDMDSVTSIANEELSFYQMLSSFSLIQNSTTNLNDNFAYNIEYKYFNPVYRSMLQTKEIYVWDNDRLVVFQYSSNPTKYYEKLPIFQEMVDSLKFEDINN
jgi:hypothetical protein